MRRKTCFWTHEKCEKSSEKDAFSVLHLRMQSQCVLQLILRRKKNKKFIQTKF